MGTEQNAKIEVSLHGAEPGKCEVHLQFPLGQSSLATLSIHQARLLAQEIIVAVNQAEVRTNLQRSHNLQRTEQLRPTGQQVVWMKNG